MPTRAEHLRAEAEKCRPQAAKAASATALFTLLDLQADLKVQAAQAELEDGPFIRKRRLADPVCAHGRFPANMIGLLPRALADDEFRDGRIWRRR
jgi:hypothetical protein